MRIAALQYCLVQKRLKVFQCRLIHLVIGSSDSVARIGEPEGELEHKKNEEVASFVTSNGYKMDRKNIEKGLTQKELNSLSLASDIKQVQ